MTTTNKDVSESGKSCPGSFVCDARHIRDLDTLAMVAKTLATRTDQQKMLCAVLKLLEQRRGMIHCAIMLLTPAGKELMLEAESTGDADDEVTCRRGEGITGRMVRYKIEKLGVDYDRFFKRKSRR